jgi:sugar O-acyltransferase (sialic acid O-acetyltransferase NeuD family)
VAQVLSIVGAGGHAKVVIATAISAGWDAANIQIFDDSPTIIGTRVLHLTVQGGTAAVLADRHASVVLAIGHNPTRARLARDAACQFATLIHSSAIVHASVVIGAGSVVFAGAIVQPDTRIGKHAIINTAASVDHDCVLGDVVHIAPGARLAGTVTVGDGSFIGIGAVVTPGRSIGAGATVGAGAAVIRDVPAGATVVGVPARAKA